MSDDRTPTPAWEHFQGRMRGLVMANELLAFVLELAIFVFIGWWALELDLDLWARLPLGAAAIAAVGFLWARFAAPRAPVRLPLPGILAVKALTFGSGTLALWAVGGPVAALVFAVLAAVNTGLSTTARSAGGR